MKTSQQWWNEVKNDAIKLGEWLVKQWRGEVTAAERIMSFSSHFAQTGKQITTLAVIASQEAQHAKWVKELLDSRHIIVDPNVVNQAEKRYWKETLPGIEDFATGAAVAAHAEGMRLERIRVICEDAETPEDIRSVFKRILKDEEFHERAFAQMSTQKALAATQGKHDLGRLALGLEA
jgi:rubrerythrin